MIKLKHILLLLLVTASTMTSAQNAVVVYQKDGTILRYAFNDKPTITYSGNDLLLTTTKTTVMYPISTLQKICFEEDETAVGTIGSSVVMFQLSSESISISGEKAGSIVYLYDISGVKQGQWTVEKDGTANIPTNGLSSGTYLVKTLTVSFKVCKSE